MSTKPTTLPVWDTADTNTAVPTTEQTSGWANHQKGVSTYMNWFQRLVYKWTEYLRDAVFVGEAGASGLEATGGTGNTKGLKGTGVGTGSGVEGTGGANGKGGSFTAGGGNNDGVLGTAAGNGAGVRGVTTGVGGVALRGDASGGTNCSGAYVQGSGNGDGILADGGATASGCYARSNATPGATGGYALKVDANGQTVRAPGRLVPQTAPTGAHLVGDFYMFTDGRLFVCITAGTPGTWMAVGVHAHGKAHSGGSPALDSGVGISAVTTNAGRLRIQFNPPMASASHYTVVVSGPAAGVACPIIADADEFEIELEDFAGAAINLAANNYAFHFAVYGKI